ncbi:MAG: glycoside hydrolase family 66 protein [Limnochordia bacterium]|nr:glycoside hydrolase family 66 protein [Limnochordia bacterium]
MLKILDLYPLKAQFGPGEALCFQLETNESAAGYLVEVVLTHLHLELAKETFPLEEGRYHTLHLATSFEKSAGYGLVAKLSTFQGEILDHMSTAFDVAHHFGEAPRYGFLCDFGPEQLGDVEDIEFLNKMHINLVQFYDWMYRHDKLVSEEPIYTDPLGRTMSQAVIQEKIKKAHEHGMQTIGYGAIYASLGDFFEEHRDWGLYQNDGTVYSLAEIFHIMDISPGSPWNSHIIEEFRKVIRFGFDGIHLDQYGFPKKALNSKGEVVDLACCFTPFISEVREAVAQERDDVALIFNNVSNFPTYATANAKQDVIYIEVWSPITEYRDLKLLIDQARHHGSHNETPKQVILAAYLAAFQAKSEFSQREAEVGALLTMAVIFASGAYHLLFGENKRVLTEGYYPNNGGMSDVFVQEVRGYYDFIVRYRELLFSADLVDLSLTHTGGYSKEIGRDNEFEFAADGVVFSPHGDLDTVWTIVKENSDHVVINLINLLGVEDGCWNAGKKATPQPVEKIRVRALIPEGVAGVHYASPSCNHGQLQELEAKRVKSTNGHMFEVELPRLDLWGMVYFVKN